MLPKLWDFNQSNKNCQGDQTQFLQLGYQWSQTLYYLQMLPRRVIIFYGPIHKALEWPWRHFPSLKLCKCSQIPHPSTIVASNSRRWHMLTFDTGWEGGKPSLLILRLLWLACVICCNQGLFFPDSVMFRDSYFPKCVMIRDCFHNVL